MSASDEPTRWRDSAVEDEDVDDVDDGTGRELVHESIRHVGPDGSSVLVSTTGAVTPEIEQATARPWTHMHEPYIYNDESWMVPLENGDVEMGFRIWRLANNEPYVPEPTYGPPVVEEEVLDALADDDANGVLHLDIQLRNFPDWNLPLRGAAHVVAAADHAALLNEREAMLEERAQQLADMSESLRSAVEAAGGSIEAMSASTGSVAVSLPVDAFDTLTSRTDLAAISRADVIPETQAYAGPPHWTQGSTSNSDRADSGTMVFSGFDGGQPNPAHAWGRVLIAILERWPFEDDGCAFMDGANCAGTRILGRYTCHDPTPGGFYCETIANWNDEAEAGDIAHGTASAAAALGDYTDDQGCGRSLHDPAWPGGAACHADAWERNASGMAPEALLLYFGKFKPMFEQISFSQMIDFSGGAVADIASISMDTEVNECNADASGSVELSAENAFDDGVFVVAAAGNNSGPTNGCNVESPADIPKVFAVNAYDTCRVSAGNCTSACQDDPYRWCLVDQTSASRGGIPVTLAGGAAGSLSAIDLVGPNRFYFHTWEVGTEGWVMDGSNPTDGSPVSGTSIATPIVAGLAAVMKDFYLNKGATWINYPGAVHTMMLAMGDRHYSTNPTSTSTSTNQRTMGADTLYGVGRAKIRFLDESGTGPLGQVRTKMQEVTFAMASGDFSNLLWLIPLSPGTDFVKCVMLQIEDTSEQGSHAFSDIDMSIRIHDPGTDTFCSLQHATLATVTDPSKDDKSMVAYENASLGGKCVEVFLDKIAVPAAGITTRTFCYASTTADDEPQ